PLHQLALAARWTFLAGRLRLRLGRILLYVLAVGVSRAADEISVPAGALLKWLPANRARFVQQLRLRLLAVEGERAAELALGVARATHERSEPAGLLDQVALVTQRADLVGVGGHRLLGCAEHPLQRPVEVADHRDPFLAAPLDLVQALLE